MLELDPHRFQLVTDCLVLLLQKDAFLGKFFNFLFALWLVLPDGLHHSLLLFVWHWTFPEKCSRVSIENHLQAVLFLFQLVHSAVHRSHVLIVGSAYQLRVSCFVTLPSFCVITCFWWLLQLIVVLIWLAQRTGRILLLHIWVCLHSILVILLRWLPKLSSLHSAGANRWQRHHHATSVVLFFEHWVLSTDLADLIVYRLHLPLHQLREACSNACSILPTGLHCLRELPPEEVRAALHGGSTLFYLRFCLLQ